MKKFFVVLIMAASMAACTSAPDAPKADAEEAKKMETSTQTGNDLAVDVEQSSVTFIGTKPIGQHTGVIQISKGSTISVENGEITGGKIDMDLTNFKITDEEMDAESAGKLTGHLQSDDFFDVANHPTATFEITGVKPYTGQAAVEGEEDKAEGATHFVSGNLTLKGVTKNISFPATLKVVDQAVKGRANFNIDRTQWGLVYGNDKSLGDRFINPQVNIQLEITTAM